MQTTVAYLPKPWEQQIDKGKTKGASDSVQINKTGQYLAKTVITAA